MNKQVYCGTISNSCGADDIKKQGVIVGRNGRSESTRGLSSQNEILELEMGRSGRSGPKDGPGCGQQLTSKEMEGRK